MGRRVNWERMMLGWRRWRSTIGRWRGRWGSTIRRWGRSNLSSRFALIRICRCFCLQRLCWERRAIADPVAVPEHCHLPFPLQEL